MVRKFVAFTCENPDCSRQGQRQKVEAVIVKLAAPNCPECGRSGKNPEVITEKLRIDPGSKVTVVVSPDTHQKLTRVKKQYNDALNTLRKAGFKFDKKK